MDRNAKSNGFNTRLFGKNRIFGKADPPEPRPLDAKDVAWFWDNRHGKRHLSRVHRQINDNINLSYLQKDKYVEATAGQNNSAVDLS